MRAAFMSAACGRAPDQQNTERDAAPHLHRGALTVLWLIGSYALVWGVMLMLGGFDVRRLRKQVSA